ncbi:Elongation factor Ts [Buchnera aphidicola (Eriosoma lanigerum)]|uniref:translation elongation factor Ts n=1 Tax=Buchnera aphidicola TaxID=9 RepID=UPI0034647B91
MINNVNVNLIQELRKRTGVGIMECKRALLEEHGDIELAVDNLRKNGLSQILKKQSNIALQGAIFTYVDNNQIGSMVEINCETDFVSRNSDFLRFGQEVVKQSAIEKIIDINLLNTKFELLKNQLIQRISENIVIRRVVITTGITVSSYIHASRIGVLVSSNFDDIKLAKHLAMHIAASKPDYLNKNNIPKEVIEREKRIQLDLIKKQNKPLFVAEKIINGKINKFINEISLLEQNFIFDLKIKVKDFLQSHGVKIKSFIRFELGENIKNNCN